MKKHLAKCLAWAFVAGVALSARADSGTVNFQGQEIAFSGAETNWVNGELVLKYTDPASVGSLNLEGAVEARMLVVGGGGAGASPAATSNMRGGAGGGGAGGFCELPLKTISGGDYKIYVGKGGDKGVATTKSEGDDGLPSAITNGTTEVAFVYGGGGGGLIEQANDGKGRPGGSGGGASARNASGSRTGGAAKDSRYGNKGGDAKTVRCGAGGGGAKTAGSPSEYNSTAKYEYGGDGGEGMESDITGEIEYYAGGGGGGTYANGTGYTSNGGSGGSGIGGDGGSRENDKPTEGKSGAVNTGSGGGGGAYNTAGGAGGSGVVIIRIKRAMPKKPPTGPFTYPYGDIQTIYTNVTPTALTIVNDATGEEVAAITTAGLSAGDHTFTSSLKAGCTWSDGTTGGVTTTIKITKPELVVKSLTVEGWQVRDTPNDPLLVVTTKDGVEITLPDDCVKYKYRKAGETVWSQARPKTEWKTAVGSLLKGTYEMTAEITGTDDFDPPPQASIPTATWLIWAAEQPVEGLGYSTTLTITGAGTADVADCQLLVRLSEGAPAFFSYRHVQPDGSDIRFASLDGTVLPMEIVTWDPEGESVFSVQVPRFKEGEQFKLCWGQLVDPTTGEDIEVPAVPALTFADYHFDFQNNVTNSGLSTLTMNADGTTPTYVDTGLSAGDRAMRKWRGYSNQALTLPSSYEIVCVARASSTSTTYHKIIWSIGTLTGGGFAIATSTKSEIRFVTWSKNEKNTIVLSKTLSPATATTAYHKYVVKVNGATAELIIDGVSVGSGTINVPKSTQLQFGSVHGGVGNLQLSANADYYISDWTLSGHGSANVTAGYLVTAANACFKNRWITEPVIPSEWGTGSEPDRKTLLGDAAYGAGSTVFTIGYPDGTVVTNEFPTVAGTYELAVVTPKGGDALKTWWSAAEGPKSVRVTKHEWTSELGGTEGSATRSGRVLLVNDFDDGKQKIANQEYGNSSGEIRWVHENAQTTVSDFPNLKSETEHALVATNAIHELCGSSNIWKLTNCYIGNTRGNPKIKGKQLVYLPLTDQNQSHIVMRNFTDAAIESAVYTNGIGTIYFDVINGTQNESVEDYKFKVEICTNGVWSTVTMHPLFKEGAAAFVPFAATEHFSPTNSVENDDTRFYRVYAPVDVRTPTAFRIVREGTVPEFKLDTGAFLLIDNIVVSYPASRVDLATYGLYDEAKMGEGVLGYEGAWNVAFPSTRDEIKPRAKAVVSTNALSSVKPEINAASLHYRWRYLNQASNAWQKVGFDKTTLSSYQPLDLPKGRVGDVEFWYEVDATSPFYKYYDYSGLKDSAGEAYGIGGLYSEEIAVVTNRLRSAVVLPSKGTDYFVRLREGQSASETFRAIVQTADGSNAFATVDFTLVDNHLWRGFLKTTDPVEKGLRFRLEETVPTSTAPEFVLATNDWKVTSDIREIPASTLYEKGATNVWNKLVCDGSSGYLKFQLDDSTHSLTVTHADWQNFNTWNDAHAKPYFVGNSTEDEKKSGVSPKMRDYEETFANWTDTPATNQYWREFFTAGSGSFSTEYPTFKPFPSGRKTPNGWTAGAGMWVNEKYMQDGASGALQMEGRGVGYLEYVTASGADSDPRGVESISYRTRLAQTIDFADIGWKYLESLSAMTNYTFVTQVAMSQTRMKSDTTVAGAYDFDGAGQVSVVACYRPGIGCYEFRVTRASETALTLALYKWTSQNGKMTATLVKSETSGTNRHPGGENMFSAWRNKNDTTTNPMFPLLYISVSRAGDGVKLQAGLSKGHTKIMTTVNEAGTAATFRTLTFWDTNPGKLKFGSYGVASANCKALFLEPCFRDQPVNWVGGTTTGPNASNEAITFSGTVTWEGDALKDDEKWIYEDGRLEAVEGANIAGFKISNVGIQAGAVPQNVVLQCTNAKNEWVDLLTNRVDGFTLSKAVTNTFYRVGNARYRLQHGGTYEDARFDVIVDSFEIRQWGGDDYGSADTATYRGTDAEHGYPTNFVFTSGWVHQDEKTPCVELNAKRATATKPCSIRTPYMDGDTLGLGLGMISFGYENVDSHVNLLLQIATNNIGKTDVKDLTASLVRQEWVTVTNFPYSVLRGARNQNFYLGIHGVKGMMRLIMDPKVVEAAAASNDPNYGRIDITGLFCRDEPALDPTCWWGWNLHTVKDDNTIKGIDDGTRMYLPDCDSRTPGLSFALNNSVTENIASGEEEVYKQNMPFLQTPTLTTPVGEVTFRARKFTNDETEPMAQVCLYGARSGLSSGEWKLLAHFNVTNTYYETYHYRSPGDTYHAFRLAIYNVPGTPKGTQGEEEKYPELKAAPVRVMIEDVVVNEAVYPTLGFKYVYPVRSGLSDHSLAPAMTNDVPNRDEQPLVGENWTVQAEIAVKQLPDELDLTKTPRVFFHWHFGKTPWGYENWKASAKSAELQRIDGHAMVYRGSLARNADAVVEEADSDTPVQYMTEVEYWDVKGDVHTNRLSQGEWVRPYWYDPIDLNAGQEEFAAFTLLGTISPGRAWINEVNLYDGMEGVELPAERNQYIEIAVPAGQSLDGWYLEYIDNKMATTNAFCYFGTGEGKVTPTKKRPETNDYVFLVVQSPKTRDAKTWEGKKMPDGQPVVIDGTWNDFDRNGGELKQNVPIALRLVRPNDVVEQEITLEGYNKWAGWGGTDSIETYTAKLNAGCESARYYIAGTESNQTYTTVFEDRLSLNVITNTGAATAEWSADRHQTPGWCNEGQSVPAGFVILPNGAMFVLSAKVDASGHLSQSIGGGEATFDPVRVSLPKGGAGTNVVYFVDPWYVLDTVKTNETPLRLPDPTRLADGHKRYEFPAMGAGCSNNLSLVASVRPWDDLEKRYGLTDDNVYKDAVMDWLNGGRNLFGREFANPGEIHLAKYLDLNGNLVTNLTLTCMYWLDMDPTDANWRFRAGTVAVDPVEKPVELKRKFLTASAIEPPGGDEPGIVAPGKNIRVTVKMFMENTETGEQYAPYVLRGVTPGMTSYDHATSGSGNWDSASFKITGDLQNSNPNRVRWVPLRWFYFMADMATEKSTSFDEKFEAVVDVWDPFDESASGGMTEGWEKYQDSPVLYRWSIDTRSMPITVEQLKPDSTYSDVE